MKKLIKKLNFAIVGIMASAPAMALDGNMKDALCKMGAEFGSIFELLQMLAFIGAGVTIAGWAWGYISGGKSVDVVKEVKEKGVGMLIGFFLLFGIGTLLSIFMSMIGEGGSLDCVQNFF
ncbi:MAG: hypothetical protein Q4C08_04805 [Pseudomonadota bacterium]|nr:hypothetical protein [Pseudomonadota bacterium]